MVPSETHSLQSLQFAQEFAFQDDDVFAVTYPKSGERTINAETSSSEIQAIRATCISLQVIRNRWELFEHHSVLVRLQQCATEITHESRCATSPQATVLEFKSDRLKA